MQGVGAFISEKTSRPEVLSVWACRLLRGRLESTPAVTACISAFSASERHVPGPLTARCGVIAVGPGRHPLHLRLPVCAVRLRAKGAPGRCVRPGERARLEGQAERVDHMIACRAYVCGVLVSVGGGGASRRAP